MRIFIALLLLGASGLSLGDAQVQSSADIFRAANVAAGNIQTAIAGHVMNDPGFQVAKQLPEDKYCPPKILVRKDGSFYFDRTRGQEARALMEDIRQGIHALQTASSTRGLDAIALAGGREYWPKLRDISCSESPGIRYYDLDGVEQHCPNR